MKRLTFEQASHSVVAESDLGRIASKEIPATSWNWREAQAEDAAKAAHFIDTFCKDLTLITEKPFKRGSSLTVIAHEGDDYPAQFLAKIAWDEFLKNYMHYLKRVIGNLKPTDEREQVFVYPVSHIVWKKGCAIVEFPDGSENIKTFKLAEPCMLSCEEVERPPHIERKLELLRQTTYDYKPYVLQSKKGSQILALHLGNTWHDIAIATWDKPRLDNISNTLLLLIVGLLSGVMLGITGYNYFENSYLKTGIAILSGLAMIFVLLFSTLWIAKRCKPLRV